MNKRDVSPLVPFCVGKRSEEFKVTQAKVRFTVSVPASSSAFSTWKEWALLLRGGGLGYFRRIFNSQA